MTKLYADSQRKYIFTGIFVKGRRAMFYEDCIYCHGTGLDTKQSRRRERGEMPIACSCVVLFPADVPINWIMLPYQLGRGIVIKKKEVKNE